MNQALPQILRDAATPYRKQKELCLFVAEELFEQRFGCSSPRQKFTEQLNNNLAKIVTTIIIIIAVIVIIQLNYFQMLIKKLQESITELAQSET
jgi:hypothetical protein